MELKYKCNEYYDDYYGIFIILDSLIDKVDKNKLLKEDRNNIIKALNIIANLKKD